MEKEIKCPYCNSDRLSLHQRGFNVGKAVAGKVLTGSFGWGAVAGSLGSSDLVYTCLDCGKTFNIKAAKRDYSYEDKQKMKEFDKYVSTEKEESQYYLCDCGKEFYASPLSPICPRCGRRQTEKNITTPAKSEKISNSWIGIAVILIAIVALILWLAL